MSDKEMSDEGARGGSKELPKMKLEDAKDSDMEVELKKSTDELSKVYPAESLIAKTSPMSLDVADLGVGEDEWQDDTGPIRGSTGKIPGVKLNTQLHLMDG